MRFPKIAALVLATAQAAAPLGITLRIQGE